MKKIVAIALALVMLLSLSVSAWADNVDTDDLVKQLTLIKNSFNTLRQSDNPTVWYYAVTDLDHNGRVELLAATTTDDGENDARLKAWEVSEDRNTLASLKLAFDLDQDGTLTQNDEFFNLMTDSADTYYDATNHATYYVFTNFAEVSEDLTGEDAAAAGGTHSDMAITFTCGISKFNDTINAGTLGLKVVETIDNGTPQVTSVDKNKNPLTDDQLLNIGYTTFSGLQRSNTSFDWFKASDATDLSRFVNSYAVFSNRKDAPDAAPVYAPAVTGPAVYVTKNPSNENRSVGGTAIFIAYADNAATVSWSFVDRSGNVKTPAEFVNICGGSVSGENSTSLYIYNVNANMNGWGAYATFYGNNQSARSTTAYIYVSGAVQSTPKPTYNNNNNNYYGLTEDEQIALGLLILAAAEEEANSYGYQESYTYYDWYCPVCGSGCNGDTCWVCGYSPYSSYEYSWVEPDYSDYWGGGYDDWGYGWDDYGWGW